MVSYSYAIWILHYNPHVLNNKLLVPYSSHDLINEPFKERTILDHLNTELIRYSDSQCIRLLKASILTLTVLGCPAFGSVLALYHIGVKIRGAHLMKFFKKTTPAPLQWPVLFNHVQNFVIFFWTVQNAHSRYVISHLHGNNFFL